MQQGLDTKRDAIVNALTDNMFYSSHHPHDTLERLRIIEAALQDPASVTEHDARNWRKAYPELPNEKLVEECLPTHALSEHTAEILQAVAKCPAVQAFDKKVTTEAILDTLTNGKHYFYSSKHPHNTLGRLRIIEAALQNPALVTEDDVREWRRDYPELPNEQLVKECLETHGLEAHTAEVLQAVEASVQAVDNETARKQQKQAQLKDFNEQLEYAKGQFIGLDKALEDEKLTGPMLTAHRAIYHPEALEPGELAEFGKNMKANLQAIEEANQSMPNNFAGLTHLAVNALSLRAKENDVRLIFPAEYVGYFPQPRKPFGDRTLAGTVELAPEELNIGSNAVG